MSNYTIDTVKIKNKYIMFKNNNDKTISLIKSNTMTEMKEKLKNKKINSGDDVVLITLEKTNWTPTSKIPLNMLGGPIKVLFTFYKTSDDSKIKKNKNDPRAIQFLYYTFDYYIKNKIKMSDLKKIAHLAFMNKLEKRPLAVKLISQIC
jgi:hypothetical protein